MPFKFHASLRHHIPRAKYRFMNCPDYNRGLAHGSGASALAIDGKTIRGAIDDEGCQAHVLGIVGHDTKAPWGQKKSV